MIACDFFSFLDFLLDSGKPSDLDVYSVQLTDSLMSNYSKFSPYCHVDDFVADNDSYLSLMRSTFPEKGRSLELVGTLIVCGRSFSTDSKHSFLHRSYYCVAFRFEHCNFSVVNIYSTKRRNATRRRK
uniref:Uncharacterized protein n=1 Tax=Dulem virus 234 TaxID=3145711 RepID=A0AAU8B7F2_9VIRU